MREAVKISINLRTSCYIPDEALVYSLIATTRTAASDSELDIMSKWRVCRICNKSRISAEQQSEANGLMNRAWVQQSLQEP